MIRVLSLLTLALSALLIAPVFAYPPPPVIEVGATYIYFSDAETGSYQYTDESSVNNVFEAPVGYSTQAGGGQRWCLSGWSAGKNTAVTGDGWKDEVAIWFTFTHTASTGSNTGITSVSSTGSWVIADQGISANRGGPVTIKVEYVQRFTTNGTSIYLAIATEDYTISYY